MIRYSERDTDLNLRPLFEMGDVEALVTAKAVDWRGLQEWVDETINWRPPGAGGGRRFVALPVAVVVFLKVGSMRSRDPAHAGAACREEDEEGADVMTRHAMR